MRSVATTIHMLQGSDVAAVVSIWNRALIRDPITEGRFVSNVLADPDYWAGEDSGFFVAAGTGRAVGFLRAIIRRMSNDRAGIEPDLGWIPVVAVTPEYQRQEIGTALLTAALEWFKKHRRRRIWVCGNSGSAPGYTFPGVDMEAYPGGMALLRKAGFVVDRESEGMSCEAVRFDVDAYRREAWKTGGDVKIATLTPRRVDDFVTFLAESFPGDWNTAARGKIRAGLLHEVLIAIVNDRVVGYCQWEGEHFGPFGVNAEFRNRRIGTKLFVEAVQRIREADGRTVWFNWAETDAARFYRRFGMEATRRFAIFRKEL
jgi:mycothiol synthase